MLLALEKTRILVGASSKSAHHWVAAGFLMHLSGVSLGSCVVAGRVPISTGGRCSTGKPFFVRRLPAFQQPSGIVRRRILRKCARFSEEQRYAQQFFSKTIRNVQASVPRTFDVTPGLVLFACAGTYAYTTWISFIFATLNGAAIALDPLPLGAVFGLLGGLVVRCVELWRRTCGGECPESIEVSTWKQACCINSDDLLEKGILLGMASISIPVGVLLGDFSLGERSVSVVKEQCTDLQKGLLQTTGSIASCAVVHGVLQQALLAQFSLMANQQVVLSNKSGYLLPLVAAGPALVPIVTALATAGLELIVYLVVCETLRPVANCEAQACQDAISVESKRCARLSTLMGVPSEVATLRAEAFEKLAAQWAEQRQVCKRRREITNLVRALTAATVYAASGGSFLAPVLTNIAVNDGVFRALTGKR